MTTEERRSATAKQYRDILEQCKKCMAQYEKDISQNALYPKKFSKRIYLAKHMELSLAQADRYLTFLNKCIPQIQDLILDSFLPFSAVDYIGYKSTAQQKNIYHTLIEENPIDGYIPRTRIIEIVQSEVSITSAEKGRKFVESVICKLTPEKGYRDAHINSKLTMDKKCDALSYTTSDQKVVFQFKYHADETLKEGISAIEEVAEARRLYDADIAIAVTNTSFSPKARAKAKEKNVILWDGAYLKGTLGWDGRI